MTFAESMRKKWLKKAVATDDKQRIHTTSGERWKLVCICYIFHIENYVKITFKGGLWPPLNVILIF